MDSKIIELMQSDDFKRCMAGEYNEVVARMRALRGMIYKYENGKLEFVPNCPVSILKKQFAIMQEYANILEWRAVIENVDLEVSNA